MRGMGTGLTAFGFDELRARIGAAERDLRGEALPAAVKEITVNAAEQAKNLIGRENFWWEPLARSTVREKRRLGYTGRVSPTDPLFRTGQMRESIEPVARGLTGAVQSDDDVMLYQDQGTKNIPARYTLLPALGMAVEAGFKLLIEAWEGVWG